MTIKLINPNKIYAITFIFLPIFFLLAFGRYGFEDADSGFVTAMGWRILQGEMPYADFYYVRPPLPLFLNALFLYLTPETGQILILRLICYLMLAGQVFMSIKVLSYYYNFDELRLNKFLMMIACFLITSTGYLYFPWHTSDGIFFAVLGFYLIVFFGSKSTLGFFLSGIVWGLAVLTKQNFILVPILGFLFIILQYDWKRFLVALSGFTPIIALFYYWLYSTSLLNIFNAQTSSSSVLKIKDLYNAGVRSYIHDHNFWLYFVSVLVAIVIVGLVNRKNFNSKMIFFVTLLNLVVFNTVISILKTGSANNPYIMIENNLLVLLVISLLVMILLKRENFKRHYVLVAFTGISWLSSISWGFTSPIQYFTPIVFGIFYILQQNWNIFDSKNYNLFVFILLTLLSFTTNLFPYRDNPIWTLTKSASLISPKAEYIITNPMRLEKHLELKDVLVKYGNATVLPSMPHVHYLHNLKNPLMADWVMDSEIAYDFEGIKENLEQSSNLVILEKKYLGQPISTAGKFYSSITVHIINNYKLIDSSYIYFNIYKKT